MSSSHPTTVEELTLEVPAGRLEVIHDHADHHDASTVDASAAHGAPAAAVDEADAQVVGTAGEERGGGDPDAAVATDPADRPAGGNGSASEALAEVSAAALLADAEVRTLSRIPSSHPLHQPRALTAAERERFRQSAKHARTQARLAAAGELDALHQVNTPALDVRELMPRREGHGLRALSLYSGGGGLDVGFERAGYDHVASYEILEHAAATLARNRPEWDVRGGPAGDVTDADWRSWRGKVDVLHGGPPCQPFSNAGRQQGHLDPRDCWPATVAAIRAVQPQAFVAENVPALASAKFADYVHDVITAPLEGSRPRWHVRRMTLEAKSFGVPQVRRRVIFVGFRSKRAAEAFTPPQPTHAWDDPTSALPPTMGVRAALGLPVLSTGAHNPDGDRVSGGEEAELSLGDRGIGDPGVTGHIADAMVDGLAPTIRSGLTGPRFTTSVCNSTSAARSWAKLGLWPNGVAATREAASAFPTQSGAFRMSVADVALIQGFPPSWTWPGAVYQAVGQIGNAVPPPLGWAVADAVTQALRA